MARSGDGGISLGRWSRWLDTRRSIYALGASLTVLAVALFAAVAESNRQAMLKDADRTAWTLAATLAEHAGRIMDVGNILAEDAMAVVEGRSWDEVSASPDAFLDLKRLSERRGFINALWLVDETGMPRATSRVFPAPNQSVADRAHFIVQKERDVGPYLSSILQSRVRDEVNMVLSRRITGPDGGFRGVALAVLNPAQFERVYRELQPGFPTVIELLRSDGSLVMRHAVPDAATGQTPAGVTEAAGGPVRPETSILTGGPIPRLVSYREVGSMPVYLGVGIAHADVTRRWLIDTLHGAAAALAGLAVLLLFVTIAAVRSGEERKVRAELEALNASLEGRIRDRTATIERLMLEVNHRAKNSLQMISSLLYMHARVAPRPEVRQELTEARSRVMTVARVHDRIYRTEQMTTVRLGDLLRDIGDDLAPTLITVDGVPVGLEVVAEPVELGVEQAVPLGLSVNELVTNAVKYAFPGGRAGRVRVGLAMGGPVSATLTVEDNGVGLPPDFDPKASTGLGMGLILGLVGQAGGTLDFGASGEGGARFSIEFPVSTPAAPAGAR